MKKMDAKGITFEIVQDFLVSLSLTLTALTISGAPLTVLFVLKETCFAWIVNMIIGFTIPEKRIGEAIAEKIGLNGLGSRMIVMLTIVVINVLGISICVVLKNVGLHKAFFNVWLKLLPPLMLVGYPAAWICSFVTMGIVKMAFKKTSDN